MSFENLDRLKICAQRYSPKIEKKLESACKGHCPMNQQKIRAAFALASLWPKGHKLRVAFMGDGSAAPRTTLAQLRKNSNFNPDPLQLIADQFTPVELVKKVISERIIPLVDLDIKFVDDPRDANIRIDFNPDHGAFSYLGSDCEDIKYPDPTMNLGWIDTAVILHEICHGFLSQIHEHSNPRGEKIQWNVPEVYAWAASTQGWDKATTDTNILKAYDITSVNGSSFDPLSIMLYFYPPELTTNGKGTLMNTRLSGLDVIWAYENYPRSDITPEEYYLKIYGENIEKAVKQSAAEAKRQGTRPFPMTLIIAIVIGLLLFGGLFVFLSKRKR